MSGRFVVVCCGCCARKSALEGRTRGRNSMIHPPTQLLQLWLDGLLSESDSGAIESHVEACVEVCRPLLKRLSSPAKSEPPSPPTDKTPGTAFLPNVLGFEVLSVLGRGGMAVVYRARRGPEQTRGRQSAPRGIRQLPRPSAAVSVKRPRSPVSFSTQPSRPSTNSGICPMAAPISP